MILKEEHMKSTGGFHTRRTVIKSGLAAASILAAPGIVRAQSKTIVTTSYGGVYERNYRALVLGKAGQILARHEFDAPDDKSALEHARQYLISNSVEIWHLKRLVDTLSPSTRG